ncbi:MAG: Required for respiratory growth protein 9 mitochondrial [Alectoria fallacina]|uniref:Required for respiratory growth protein 9, mitochondrial n=1 Tax=Alectoria fallacina TaxID=1903189 RepID=A0A8H3JAT2_9LECA|nr:MAG: Required for respiratory growth protein 9 mitochondrial [Alectoria fallacina]
MPCSVCAASALRCVILGAEVARIAGLRFRNVRSSSIGTPRHLFHISSSTLRNRSVRTQHISTLQPSQIPGFHAAITLGEDPRRREEPSHRHRNGSRIGVEVPIRIHGLIGEAAQISMIPVALRSRRYSMKSGGFPKPQPSLKNEESFDRHWPKENVKGPGQSDYAIYGISKDSIRKETPRSSNSTVISGKARLHDYSSRTVEANKGAMLSSQSTNASADFRSGTQNHKDQRELWQTQKSALSEKFGPTGWLPRKRLSPDTLEGIRALHAQYPDKFPTPVLADQFKVSPEAIRRILKSKWRPKDKEEESRRQRWEKRGENIWSQMVEMGIKPPKKWRDMGVGKSRERNPARSKQLEHQNKSESKVTSSLLGESTTNLHTIPANMHEKDSRIPLADRIV